MFTWFLGGHAYGLVNDPADIPEDGDLFLDFTCPWVPPEQALLKLAAAYPACTFQIQYEEPGMAVYGKLTYSGGALVEDNPMGVEDYLDEFDEGYNDLIADIEESEYGVFLQNLSGIDSLQDDAETCQWPGLVEKHYLKRLKKEDLPLLVNHVWISDTNKTEYERRLKGETTCPTPEPSKS